MITIKVRSRNEDINTIRVIGHAGYAANGEDIICAAVSALAISLLNALEEVAQAVIEKRIDEGDIFIKVPPQQDEQRHRAAQVLLRSFFLSAENLARENPRYVKVETQEE